jgi:hypothetical protein
MRMPHVKSVGKTGSGSAFATTQGPVRPSEAVRWSATTGSIVDVISLAKEKWWLRRNTRLGDMLQQALAAARLARGGGAVGYGRDGDYGG